MMDVVKMLVFPFCLLILICLVTANFEGSEPSAFKQGTVEKAKCQKERKGNYVGQYVYPYSMRAWMGLFIGFRAECAVES